MHKTEDLTSKLLRKSRVDMKYCQNPWNSECNNPDIVLYIVNKGEKIPICRPCWQKITEFEIEW